MKKVTGIGGVFFKCNDVDSTRQWYERHLGIPSGEYGGHFEWRDAEHPESGKKYTAWNPFRQDSNYFDPGEQEFMINYRVEDLEKLIGEMTANGVRQIGEIEYYPYGKFAWIIDCDGRKVELWEPVDKELGLE